MRQGSRLVLVVILILIGRAAWATNTWALIIGIDGYKYPYRGLRYAVNDAESIYDVLTDPHYGGIDKSHVWLVTDENTTPTRETIIRSLDQLVANCKPGDRLIFYFTGHGICANSRSYLVPIDGQGQSDQAIESTCLSADEIVKRISGSGASEILLFIDACRAHPEGEKGAPDKGQDMTDDFSKAFVIRPRYGGAKMTATFYACSLGESA
ncbi:MAG: caspase family protein, partial [Candidatus Marsarchaeota archaeon]|nr:caspase family protein [Candidatus Marsarchaeota archaeon]